MLEWLGNLNGGAVFPARALEKAKARLPSAHTECRRRRWILPGASLLPLSSRRVTSTCTLLFTPYEPPASKAISPLRLPDRSSPQLTEEYADAVQALMGSSWMAERAAEELRELEAEHPGRFGLLKLELRSLIYEAGGCRSFPSMPYAGQPWVVERAVEELRALEVEHPNRHGRLKLELRAFISDSLRSSPSQPPAGVFLPPLPSTSSAATQESSNLKRRKREANNQRVATADAMGQKLRPKATRDSVDMALERAEQCLKKIRRVKESLARGC